VNRNEINCRGAEVALEWRLSPAWRVGSSLSYVNARRDPGNVRMRARPQWRGGVFLNWAPMAALTLTGAITAVDRIPDSSVPTGDVWLDSWARCDIAAAWRVRDNWSVTVAIENLLDAQYEEAVGFPALGRAARVGLRAEF
jgi:outer membrane receptor protein involved in Fe transport